MIQVGIVDDHAMVRTGLKQYLSEHVDVRVTHAMTHKLIQ